MVSILVVDDETTIAEVVSLYLQREGWQVHIAQDGQQALDLIHKALPSLVVLDLNLPKVQGLEILRQLRRPPNPYVPVIILTDQSQEQDRIRGLEMGADDYVPKPFSTAELVSRVKAVLRRLQIDSQQKLNEKRPLRFGTLYIDPNSHIVQVNQQTINLTATEFELLYFLARHPKNVFSREQLLEKVRGYDQSDVANTIYVHMQRLRRKLEPNPKQPIWLHTVWGTGYKFDPVVEVE